MKRFLYALLFALSSLSFAAAVHAETIREFSVQAELSADRRLEITETIRYDFQGALRHGIFRIIPERYYRSGGRFNLRLSVGQPMLDGEPVPYDVSRSGDSREIKIGDPDRTISGVHAYVIPYSTSRAINDFPEDRERELYWNVTGDEWSVPIESSRFVLKGPSAPTRVICFVGVFGSTEETCETNIVGSTVTVVSSRPLRPGEGLTVAVRYPEDALAALSARDIMRDFLLDNLWLFTPFLVLLGMWLVWRRYGKDPIGRGTVIAQYEEPRGLTPMQMAALLKQDVPPEAVTGAILDLARRGYIKVRIEGDPEAKGWFKEKAKFYLKKEKEYVGGTPHERALFDGLFVLDEEIDVTEPSSTTAKAVLEAKGKVMKELADMKLFKKSPGAVRALWIVAAFVIFAAHFIFAEISGPLIFLSGAVSALIVAFFGWHMPSVTHDGAVAREEIEGFKLFLSVTEKQRLEFHNAPATKPEQFERFLPAAVAFGVEELWAKHFENMHIDPVSYTSGNTSGWNALAFAHGMTLLNQASLSGAYHAPSSAGSGGSGFSGGGSGGGFGGGGGGSW